MVRKRISHNVNFRLGDIYALVNWVSIISDNRLLMPNHYLNKWWHVFNHALRNIFQLNYIWNSKDFTQENAFENLIWIMSANLSWFPYVRDISGLVQERCNPTASAMELHLPCTNPSIYDFTCVNIAKVLDMYSTLQEIWIWFVPSCALMLTGSSLEESG